MFCILTDDGLSMMPKSNCFIFIFIILLTETKLNKFCVLIMLSFLGVVCMFLWDIIIWSMGIGTDIFCFRFVILDSWLYFTTSPPQSLKKLDLNQTHAPPDKNNVINVQNDGLTAPITISSFSTSEENFIGTKLILNFLHACISISDFRSRL